MPIDPTAFSKRIRLGEDTGVELKEVRLRGRKVAAPKRTDLADGFAAFANSSGGWFVLGVRDDRTRQALTPNQLDSVAEMVTAVCSDSIEPPLDFNLHRMPAPGPSDEGVLLVEIPRGAEVHRSPGGYFRRRGAGKRPLETAELGRLLQARARSDETGADMQLVANTGAGSLAPEHWRRYASSRSSDSPEVMLAKLKFLKDDELGTPRATVGGILLASDDPREWLPNAYIQAVCYGGGTRDGNRQLDAQDIGGPLDEQIRGAMRFVVRNRRVAARKDPARTDIPQYSERAVFEAVVSTVVHRDYGVAGSRIRLFMFDDRLELISPGTLGNSLTVEDLRTSQFTRNELLASRLGQCPVGDVPGSGGRRHFIERRGEGIGVIEEETLALAGSRPAFEAVGEREFRVTLPAASPPVPDGLATRVAVRQADTGRPVRDVRVVVVYPNKTCLETRTDAFGHADFELYAELPLTILCAVPGLRAHVERGHCGGDGLEVEMRTADHGGSMIIANRTGHLPGIKEFELSLLARGVPAAERRPTVATGAERVDDRRSDDRSVDPASADMGSDHGDQVRADMDVDHAAGRLTARQRAIMAACDVPRSLAELMERAGVSHRSHFRRKHLKPLLEAGLVRMTNPGSPRGPNQRYALTDAGAALKWEVGTEVRRL